MLATTLDVHGIAVLLLTIVALFLFTRDNIPLESSSLTILIILVAGFELFPYEPDGERLLRPVDFFAGFGSEALVAICALMMVGKALETTGALQPLATIVGRAWSRKPILALLATLVAGAILSAFMNNTPIVVLLMLGISILGNQFELQSGLSVALFPMVILAMTVERMSTVWEERGANDAVKQGVGSLAVAAVCYAVMDMQIVQHLMFVFPESLLIVLALTLLIGRYTGYRLTELRRFRELVLREGAD